MTDNYWKDYSEFITKVETITKLSPVSLLELYTDFIDSLESQTSNSFSIFELEIDNDFNFRSQIQKVLECEDLSTNELKKEFENKIIELDKTLKTYLTLDCAKRADWYKSIQLDTTKINLN